MNTAASTLLRSLETLGVLSVRFRVLGLGRQMRHTVPVAISEDQQTSNERLNSLSISDLFNAYALRPRKGDYVLNVEGGQLAYIPPMAPVPSNEIATLKKHRSKSKAARGRRRSFASSPHKLAA